jgi:hypothetical protein
MPLVRFLRSAAVLALATAGCSTSSSAGVRDGGLVATDSGDDAAASADATEIDSSEPVDATMDAEPDTSPAPPVDAAPVDAAFACANPSSIGDCAYCLTRDACVNCATLGAGQGAAALAFKSVLQCVECTACYTSCSGSKVGCSKPAAADPCDSFGSTAAQCEACQACAVRGATVEAGAGSCSGQQATCASTPGCGQLLAGTEAACKNLP